MLLLLLLVRPACMHQAAEIEQLPAAACPSPPAAG
jgi:hypothetical protein